MATNPQPAALPLLIRSLLDANLAPAVFSHPVKHLKLIETHISWVILTGTYAYKLKKPVDFGFLDFSTLEKRRFFCNEELRLNRRYAEALYLDVVAITGSDAEPRINGEGPVLEYAVKMREFPQHCLFEACLRRGEISNQDIDDLAIRLASFHETAGLVEAIVAETNKVEEGAGSASGRGAYAAVSGPVLQNFKQISKIKGLGDIGKPPQHLYEWTLNELEQLTPDFQNRQQLGFIRECHGDLHLGNIAVIDGEITFFDGIEFSEPLRFIDTQSELAYLLMDLEDKQFDRLAHRVCNQYLERCGDYAGLIVQRFYKVYRAMVRAKVNALRLGQSDVQPEERALCLENIRHYLNLAERYTAPEKPFLAITHGLSGSGKTVLSMDVVESCGAIRLRSDVERKRLHGLAADESSHSAPGEGLYTAQATEQTFNYLATTSNTLLDAGYSVIVDATFLSKALRDRFYSLAQQKELPFVIFHCEETIETLQLRLQQRSNETGEASEADESILQRQLANQDKLTQQEQRLCFPLVADSRFNNDRFRKFLAVDSGAR